MQNYAVPHLDEGLHFCTSWKLGEPFNRINFHFYKFYLGAVYRANCRSQHKRLPAVDNAFGVFWKNYSSTLYFIQAENAPPTHFLSLFWLLDKFPVNDFNHMTIPSNKGIFGFFIPYGHLLWGKSFDYSDAYITVNMPVTLKHKNSV